MKVFLTSFKKYHENEVPDGWKGYSISVYQPHWFKALPKIDGFDIRDSNGNWIRPRDFIPANHDASKPSKMILDSYRDALVSLYNQRRYQLMSDLSVLQFNCKVAVLCCWCPYDKAAKRQLKDYGSFICHSAAVEVWLKKNGFDVLRDKDREKMVCLDIE